MKPIHLLVTTSTSSSIIYQQLLTKLIGENVVPHTISGESFQTKHRRRSRRRESSVFSACGLCFYFEVRCEFFFPPWESLATWRSSGRPSGWARRQAEQQSGQGRPDSRTECRRAAGGRAEGSDACFCNFHATFTCRAPQHATRQTSTKDDNKPLFFSFIKTSLARPREVCRELSAAPHRSPPCPDPTTKLCTPSAASSTSRDWASRPGTSSE